MVGKSCENKQTARKEKINVLFSIKHQNKTIDILIDEIKNSQELQQFNNGNHYHNKFGKYFDFDENNNLIEVKKSYAINYEIVNIELIETDNELLDFVISELKQQGSEIAARRLLITIEPDFDVDSRYDIDTLKLEIEDYIQEEISNLQFFKKMNKKNSNFTKLVI